jgi:hypothetical protein
VKQTLSAVADNVIYMYWGKAGAVDVSSGPTVFSAFRFVNHGNDLDSAGNHYFYGNTIADDVGLWGASKHFLTNYRTAGVYSGTDASSVGVSASSWVKVGTQAAASKGVISVMDGANVTRNWGLNLSAHNPHRVQFGVNQVGNVFKDGATGLTTGEWTLIGGKFNGGPSAASIYVYRNGAPDGYVYLGGVRTGTNAQTDHGRFNTNDVNRLPDDYLHETRFMIGNLSDAWYAADYANQYSPDTFYTWGAVEPTSSFNAAWFLMNA